MRLRDLSLKTKLQAANVLMVVIPIAVLIVIGAALLGGLRHTGTLQQQALALLWPEQGRTLSVQFALSSLCAAAEKRKFRQHDVQSDIRLLGSAGVRLLIKQKGENYLTKGVHPVELARHKKIAHPFG